MFRCSICGKSVRTSQGLAGHKWLKHAKKKLEQAAVTGAAAHQAQAQAAQPQNTDSVMVPASYLAQLQMQAQQLVKLQQEGLDSADGRTVRIDPLVLRLPQEEGL